MVPSSVACQGPLGKGTLTHCNSSLSLLAWRNWSFSVTSPQALGEMCGPQERQRGPAPIQGGPESKDRPGKGHMCFLMAQLMVGLEARLLLGGLGPLLPPCKVGRSPYWQEEGVALDLCLPRCGLHPQRPPRHPHHCGHLVSRSLCSSFSTLWPQGQHAAYTCQQEGPGAAQGPSGLDLPPRNNTPSDTMPPLPHMSHAPHPAHVRPNPDPPTRLRAGNKGQAPLL